MTSFRSEKCCRLVTARRICSSVCQFLIHHITLLCSLAFHWFCDRRTDRQTPTACYRVIVLLLLLLLFLFIFLLLLLLLLCCCCCYSLVYIFTALFSFFTFLLCTSSTISLINNPTRHHQSLAQTGAWQVGYTYSLITCTSTGNDDCWVISISLAMTAPFYHSLARDSML